MDVGVEEDELAPRRQSLESTTAITCQPVVTRHGYGVGQP